jgi:hypothetical protein
MKKQLLKSLLAFSLVAPIFTAGAATYDVGTFYTTPDNPEGDYSIETSGLFWDEFDFYTRALGGSWRDRTSMTFSGSHSGMFDNELLLIDLNSRQTYNLAEDFSVTIDNLSGRERFAIAGAGLNSSDPTILSNYSFSMNAEFDPYQPGPNPVPLPATAWLFVSGLMGLVTTYRRKRSTA